jgi:hypothetical protein
LPTSPPEENSSKVGRNSGLRLRPKNFRFKINGTQNNWRNMVVAFVAALKMVELSEKQPGQF